MRFDDTLNTVLAADLSTAFGKASAWRQLVDLIGRRRIADDARALALLESIRADVPVTVRAASARALEIAHPPAGLAKLCAVDDISVAAPVLRSARLSSGEWIELLPQLSSAGRTVLRNRRDLPPGIDQALESFGVVDFVIASDFTDEFEQTLASAELAEPNLPAELKVAGDAAPVVLEADGDTMPVAEADTVPDPGARPGWTFVSIGAAALAIPVVAAAMQQAATAPGDNDGVAVPQSETSREPLSATTLAGESGEAHDSRMLEQATSIGELTAAAVEGRVAEDAVEFTNPVTPHDPEGPFEIAEVVARIDAFYTHRQDHQAVLPVPVRIDGFRFETDEQGIIRWVDGVSRAPLIGLSLDMTAMPEGSRVDGVAAGAFRRRAGFSDARLFVAGESDAAGDWRISANAAFDPATGRFCGYRGGARRPRVEQTAEVQVAQSGRAADSLRQLMHELRTPTNAIAGFAELIEREMLGEVQAVYRERAAAIRDHSRNLLAAIDDLDIAARIEASALRLYPGEVALRPLLSRVAEDLSVLATIRGARILVPTDDLAISGDARAVERMLSRLLATLVSAAGDGECVGVRLAADSDDTIAISFDRPAALAAYRGDAVFGIDDEREDVALLGTGFALRLIRNLARELSGSFVIEADRFTIRLPAAVTKSLEQAR